MWSNTDNGQLERCDQIQIKDRKMWSNTERCDQIKVN